MEQVENEFGIPHREPGLKSGMLTYNEDQPQGDCGPRMMTDGYQPPRWLKWLLRRVILINAWYARRWRKRHPANEIVVSKEWAERMAKQMPDFIEKIRDFDGEGKAKIRIKPSANGLNGMNINDPEFRRQITARAEAHHWEDLEKMYGRFRRTNLGTSDNKRTDKTD